MQLNPTPKTKLGGRPARSILEPTQREAMLDEARRMAEVGLTDFELCRVWGINRETLYQWQIRDPALREAMQLGKEASDARVERSLYHKAVGYTFESEKIFCTDGLVTRVPVTEHVPPDTGSAIFWLKNRQRDRWRDKIDVDAEVKVETTGDATQLALALLATMQAALAQGNKPTIDVTPSEDSDDATD